MTVQDEAIRVLGARAAGIAALAKVCGDAALADPDTATLGQAITAIGELAGDLERDLLTMVE